MGFLDDVTRGGRRRCEEEVQRLVESGLTREQATQLARKHFGDEGDEPRRGAIGPVELMGWLTLVALLALGVTLGYMLRELGGAGRR